MEFEKVAETSDNIKSENNKFKEIKFSAEITIDKAIEFAKSIFQDLKSNIDDGKWIDALNEIREDYIKEIREYSEFKDTLPDKYFEVTELKKVTSEDNKIIREEFNMNKADLIKQWETLHGRAWPTYKENVIITKANGETTCIRVAGQKYDIHHIQPLGLGGKNDVNNITPMNADVHFDSRGVHRLDGAYGRINRMLGVE